MFLSFPLISLPQTFQKAEEWEDAECEVSEEKSLSVKSLSQSSLHRRKSRQGTSFAASEGEAEVKEKFNEDDVEEVSCAVVWVAGSILSKWSEQALQ